MLTYSEVSSLSGDPSWSYSPTPRHDVSVSAMVGAVQQQALNELFSPLRLQRIDDLSAKYGPGKTMSMTDLFDWARSSIYGSISDGSVAKEGLVRRNLQTAYANFLERIVAFGTPLYPSDAVALARVNLSDLSSSATAALHRGGLDELTQGHLMSLRAIAERALNPRNSITINIGGGIP
jgi:hypothetical protein